MKGLASVKTWVALFALIIIPVITIMEFLPESYAVIVASGWLGIIAWPAAEHWAKKWR